MMSLGLILAKAEKNPKDSPYYLQYASASDTKIEKLYVSKQQSDYLANKDLEVGLIFTKYQANSNNNKKWFPQCLIQVKDISNKNDDYFYEFKKPRGLSSDNVVFIVNAGYPVNVTQADGKYNVSTNLPMLPIRQPISLSDYYYQDDIISRYNSNTIRLCNSNSGSKRYSRKTPK